MLSGCCQVRRATFALPGRTAKDPHCDNASTTLRYDCCLRRRATRGAGSVRIQPAAEDRAGVALACQRHLVTKPIHPHASPFADPTVSPSTRSANAATTRTQKVLVVIEENHSYVQMKQGMPFLAGLSSKYGYATHWTALAHPSLPNYLGIAGGTTFGILDDRSPAAHASDIGSAISVFDQAIGSGKTAGTYAETMSRTATSTTTPTGPSERRSTPSGTTRGCTSPRAAATAWPTTGT